MNETDDDNDVFAAAAAEDLHPIHYTDVFVAVGFAAADDFLPTHYREVFVVASAAEDLHPIHYRSLDLATVVAFCR
ncbi:hypothetical protein A2U01_0077340, partial [Trifolium medium]|nr:hypothetical protein [Trifolium medium]